jgi:hypothetical protein
MLWHPERGDQSPDALEAEADPEGLERSQPGLRVTV